MSSLEPHLSCCLWRPLPGLAGLPWVALPFPFGVGSWVRKPWWPSGPGLRAQSKVKARLSMGQAGAPWFSQGHVLDISPPGVLGECHRQGADQLP